MKTCTKCNTPKKESEFYVRDAAGTTRRDCKQCQLKYQKRYRKENPEKVAAVGKAYREGNRESIAAYQREYKKEHREEAAARDKAYGAKNRERIAAQKKVYEYGLAHGDYNRMLLEQRGVCAICKSPRGKKSLCIDHDHGSGKVRALLCSRCNSAIGLLRDSSSIAQLATNYLRLHGK